MAQDLVKAKVMDPDLPFQPMTPRRALALLKGVRLQHISAGNKQITLVNRRGVSRPRCSKPSKSTPQPDVPHFSMMIWPPTSPGHRFAAWDRADVAA